MEKFTDIDESFTETIRTSDLKDVVTDTAENFIDNLLENGVLKEIPIIGAILGIGKTALSIKDVLFLKKIFSFLSEVHKVEPQQRRKVIDSVNDSEKYKVKVGEKLIYILDRCDDHIDAKYIAQFFNAFLEEKIGYDDFLKGSRIIQNIFIADLEYFLDNEISEFEITGSSEEYPHEDQFPLINVGLCSFGYNAVRLEQAYKYFDEREVRGGDAVVWVTTIGKKLKEVLIKEN